MGLNVLRPVGDRLPYDVAIEREGKLVRIQVKSAWYHDHTSSWHVDTRRCQTNRRVYKQTKYLVEDFDLLIAWLPKEDVFYIFPSWLVGLYGGTITMVEGVVRQRPPKSLFYRNRWDLIHIDNHSEIPESEMSMLQSLRKLKSSEAFVQKVELLKREEHLNLPAIAERLSVPVSTVRYRLHMWRKNHRSVA